MAGGSLQDEDPPFGVCCAPGGVRIELDLGHPDGAGDWLLVVMGGKPCICTNTHTHIHAHAHAHTCTCVRTHRHTRTRKALEFEFNLVSLKVGLCHYINY